MINQEGNTLVRTDEFRLRVTAEELRTHFAQVIAGYESDIKEMTEDLPVIEELAEILRRDDSPQNQLALASATQKYHGFGNLGDPVKELKLRIENADKRRMFFVFASDHMAVEHYDLTPHQLRELGYVF